MGGKTRTEKNGAYTNCMPCSQVVHAPFTTSPHPIFMKQEPVEWSVYGKFFLCLLYIRVSSAQSRNVAGGILVNSVLLHSIKGTCRASVHEAIIQ